MPQRHAAHDALARTLAGQPERGVWHRAASVIGPDEAVAGELEATALSAQRRGASIVAVSALRRAATLGDDGRQAGRLLRAAELGFELGRQDLVQNLLAEAAPHDLSPREQARVAWIRDSFADGIPGETSKARSLVVSADRADADGDTDLALKLLYGAALRCWWADPGSATRDQVAATAEGLAVAVAEDDPRLLVVLALAAPTGSGAKVVERLYGLGPAIEADAAATRLAGTAAMAVGAFDLAAGFLAISAASLRAQGRLGLLARALALQAWSAAQLADLGAAIPAAAEARRLAQETRQPLIMATADAVQALLAALRGDEQAAWALAAQAEEISVPIGASAVLAATQLARGLAALGAGRPADALEHLRRIHDPADPAITTGSGASQSAIWPRPPCAAARWRASAGLCAIWRRPGGILRRRRSRPACATLARCSPTTLRRRGCSTPHCGPALPFQRARMQLAHGEWLHQHRQNTASRAPLRAARETFDALGLVPWSERARQQLRATGETSRPRTPQARDQLTPRGTADRPAGGRGHEQPRDRPAALPLPPDGQLAPVSGLPQTRDHLPRRTARGARPLTAVGYRLAISCQVRPLRTLAGDSATMSEPGRASSSRALTRIQRRSPVRVSAKPPFSLLPCRMKDICPASSVTISAGPSSQTITAPLPRPCPSCTPSNSPADRSWSSTGTATRRIRGRATVPWAPPTSAARRRPAAQIEVERGRIVQLHDEARRCRGRWHAVRVSSGD